MHKFSKYTDQLDVDLYEMRLHKNQLVYIRKDLANSLLQKQSSSISTYYQILMGEMMIISAREHFDPTNAESVYLTLVNGCNVPPHKLSSNNSRGFSLESDKRLKPILEKALEYPNTESNENIIRILEPYIAWKSVKNQTGTMRNNLNKAVKTPFTNEYGDELCGFKFLVAKQTNLRFNYSNVALINIPKMYNHAISCPKGRVLVWGDFEQSDLRIAYNLLLRTKENSKIMDEAKDKYEGIARLLALANNEEFSVDKFKEERPLYKETVLATIYGKEGSGSERAMDIIKKMKVFLNSCPRYKEFLRRIYLNIALGKPIILTGYFGHEEIREVGFDLKADIDFCLNSPNQTGTSELIILLVNAILDTFYSLGYTEDQIYVYYVRHDEPIFVMDECVLEDAWVFKQYEDIFVDNWTPLKMSFEAGYIYKEPNEGLMNKMKNSVTLNKDKITLISRDESQDIEEYYPIADVMTFGVNTMTYTDNGVQKTIVGIYNDTDKTFGIITLATTDRYAIYNTVQNCILQNEEDYIKRNYSDILIFSPFEEQATFSENGSFIKNSCNLNEHLFKNIYKKSVILSKFVISKSTKPELHQKILDSNKEWINNIKGVEFHG